MKTIFKTLSLVLVLALTGIVENVKAVTNTNQIAQTQNKENNKPINLALPVIADIQLKDGRSLTGKVIVFDSKGQTIQFFVSGDSRSFPVAQIQQITFRKDKDASIYTSGGEVVIRGENNAKAKQSIWSNIPLQAFELVDPKLGQALVNLETVKSQKELRQIRSVAANSLYVVDEILFEDTGKMTIKVTPNGIKISTNL